jgi:hypothetical protein
MVNVLTSFVVPAAVITVPPFTTKLPGFDDPNTKDEPSRRVPESAILIEGVLAKVAEPWMDKVPSLIVVGPR